MMGQRGPARTPTAKLVNRQSWRGKERAASEPSYPDLSSSAPKWLDDEAKKLWRRLVKILEPVRVARDSDREALASLCQSWGEYQMLRRQVDQEGFVLTHFIGWKKKPRTKPAEYVEITQRRANPAAKLMHEAWGRYVKLSLEFGLTPASRSRTAAGVEAAKQEENDKVVPFSPWNRKAS